MSAEQQPCPTCGSEAAELLALLERMQAGKRHVGLLCSSDTGTWNCVWLTHEGAMHQGLGSTAPEAVRACWEKGQE